MFLNISHLLQQKEPGSIDERKHQIAKDLLDVNLGYLSEREISTLTSTGKKRSGINGWLLYRKQTDYLEFSKIIL